MENDNRFQRGAILYFEPFIFLDGGKPKPKYFIVLTHIDNTLLLASLPTTKDSLPAYLEKHHGCINIPEINLNCYYFSPQYIICDNGFSFPIETYVYGFRLQLFDMENFIQQEQQEHITITQKGILLDKEYNALVKCLSKSASVKRKFRKILTFTN